MIDWTYTLSELMDITFSSYVLLENEIQDRHNAGQENKRFEWNVFTFIHFSALQTSVGALQFDNWRYS